MLKFNPTTPIKFYAKAEGTYVPGQGANDAWELIESGIYSVFYCEWKGSFGDRAISAEALGVKDSATVRTFYNPTVYAKLRSVQVVVIKNADDTAIVDGVPDKKNPNVYELWGGADNVKEENQYMEFRVREVRRPMIKDLVQTTLDAALYPDAYVYWQRKSGRDADEYVVYTLGVDSNEDFADDVPLTKAASITVRYYYRAEKLDTRAGRQAIESREDTIESALESAGFSIPDGKFDAGDVDDIGFYVTVFECEYWRVV